MPTKMRTTVLFTLLLLGSPGILRGPVAGHEEAFSQGTAGVGLILRQLDGVKRVLVVAAHPDDEDTALITALSRGLGARVAYLSLSRGEGGQNLIGDELDEGLGILRSGELLAARALDGGEQYFSRAFDFGYSKTLEESLSFWPRDEILADVTWVVRTFRPQVMVSVFSGTERDGHGQHQMAGMVAREAFEAAGDPGAFPEQLERGAILWSPVKLYRLARFGPGEIATEVETGTFDPLLGRSHYQLAMESRSQHRSQDMGRPQPMGPRSSRLSLMESRVENGAADGPGFFSGVDTTLVGLAHELTLPKGESVVGALETYREALTRARGELKALAPWAITPHLLKGLEALRQARMELDETEAGELARVLDRRIPLVEEAILQSAGVVMDVRILDDILVPGESVGVEVEVWNGGPYALAEGETQLHLPGGWDAVLEEAPSPGVTAGETRTWRYAVTLPENAALSRPYFMREERDGEIYRWPEDPDLWARAANPPLVRGTFRGQMRGGGWEGGVEVSLVQDGVYRGLDKATGEFVESPLVMPALSVSMDPGSQIWPLASHGPRVFTVRVRNESAQGRGGQLSLELPSGWRSDPASHPFRFPEPGAEASFSFSVLPPADRSPGLYAVEAVARTHQGESFREGVSLVDYRHIRRAALFTPARARVSVLPVEVREGIRVGYVMGSGDMGPEILRQMGVELTMLSPETVLSGDFRGLDAIVLGIRAYETRPDVAAANGALLDFAREGGTLIVQYNKYEFPQGGFAPFTVEMSRPHDRVADETAPVKVLDPDHPLFTKPNRITQEDFRGWAQERGLYFLSEWDSRYTPLLEMADPEEDPKRGGLVVAPLGQGLYIYTGVAFFRQFPDGVPGAIRLFANLVSLQREDLNAR